ncbi:hypothetical protein JN06_01330 [Bacteroides zoogleoformans]|uniref:Uncharacterized protein n=1 Tax=Bacteroides zoogleoformans TaxID=28119 RepID=A0ABM6T8X6_9BACE|nr:hypothetical protein [Bacteroides zoogleoformans]AVM53298.1 hypothetical protein C4H11_10485 [Bacteroides zoogleoformans]TWJ14397.1 hypothetical protein JN06_01330 [Bacteroides zoogleoformans]
MKALITKKVTVVRNENLLDPDTGLIKDVCWVGMNSRITVYYLLFIPIYRKEEKFNDVDTAEL